MSNRFDNLYDVDQAEFQALVARAMRKARRERAETVAKIFGGLWNGLRRGFKSTPQKPAIANHEHRSLAGCS